MYNKIHKLISNSKISLNQLNLLPTKAYYSTKINHKVKTDAIRNKCNAKTKKGLQCKNKRSIGEYCNLHHFLLISASGEQSKNTMCVAKTKKGIQCKNSKKHGNYCSMHSKIEAEKNKDLLQSGDIKKNNLNYDKFKLSFLDSQNKKCAAKTRRGSMCKNNKKYGEYCSIHAKLKIKKNKDVLPFKSNSKIRNKANGRQDLCPWPAPISEFNNVVGIHLCRPQSSNITWEDMLNCWRACVVNLDECLKVFDDKEILILPVLDKPILFVALYPLLDKGIIKKYNVLAPYSKTEICIPESYMKTKYDYWYKPVKTYIEDARGAKRWWDNKWAMEAGKDIDSLN